MLLVRNAHTHAHTIMTCRSIFRFYFFIAEPGVLSLTSLVSEVCATAVVDDASTHAHARARSFDRVCKGRRHTAACRSRSWRTGWTACGTEPRWGSKIEIQPQYLQVDRPLTLWFQCYSTEHATTQEPLTFSEARRLLVASN